MDNPFKYGSIVEGPYFADRETEIGELVREMENLSRVFLISPRRLGKTCLLFNLMKRLRENSFAVAYLDLNACPDLSSMAVSFTQAAFRALESNVDKLLRMFSAFKRLRPRVSVGPDGALSAGVEVTGDSREGLPALLEGMRSAGALAEKKDRKLVVIIDEFSDLPKYDGDSVEKALRSEIQLHKMVGYIFSGSEQSVMLELCRDPARAFYKMGRIMGLSPIPRDIYGRFVDGWFQKAGVAVDKDYVERIFELGEDVPYNIQRMCHILWEKTLGGEGRRIATWSRLCPILLQGRTRPISSWSGSPSPSSRNHS